jgi:hypothetical protein
MSLVIELSPHEEARPAAAAKEEGIAPADLARKVLTDSLPPMAEGPQPEDPTLALFDQWAAEDAKRTPEEAAQENALWEQFLTNINETRAALGMRKL